MEVKSLAAVSLVNTDLVLLDLDNTLYEYERCHQYALQKLFSACDELLHLTATEANNLYHEGRKAVHHTHLGTACSHSRLLYIQRMVEKALGRTNPSLILKLHSVYWDNYIEHMQLYSDAIPFLEKCHTRGAMLVMVTDMLSHIQFKKAEQLNIAGYFQYIVSSEEAGVEKPHPYIFELAISKALLLKPGIKNIAVVGDSVKKDVHSSDIYHISVYHILRDE